MHKVLIIGALGAAAIVVRKVLGVARRRATDQPPVPAPEPE
jgi:hypothetical protein